VPEKNSLSLLAVNDPRRGDRESFISFVQRRVSFMSDQTIQSENNPYKSPQTSSPAVKTQPGLRLWPGLALIVAMWLGWAIASIGEFSPLRFFYGMIVAPMVALVGVLVWWLFASRIRWSDRFLIAGSFVAVAAITIAVSYTDFHPMAMVLYVVPKVLTAWVGWLAVSYFFPWSVRRAVLVLIFAATGALCSSLRIEGMNGEFVAKFSWRWTPKSEDAFLAELKAKPDRASSALQVKSEVREEPGDWTGFRGPRRDSRLTGVRIKTDWQQSPPKMLWRHHVGPGWSSFAVVGDQLFTQEQRGPDEYVVCYSVATGDELWSSHDETRFTEMVAGPGPRATPTFHDGKLYTYGANGHLNCLDAATGKRLWSHDVATEFKAANADKTDVPMWGFASSPLVTQGVVIVFAGARDGKTLVGYKEEKGELAWTANVGPAPDTPEKVALSYCSPQLATVEGTEQVLMATDAGLSGFEPVHGKELWHYSWPVDKTPRIVQPALVGESDVLVGTGMGNGTRRVHLSRKGDEWQTEETWKTTRYKPYFNDFVVFNDYLYGFDSGKFVCLKLNDEGKDKWHASGYGSGQVLLLADQGLLLILSEEGDVALVAAKPEKHEELCRFKAIEGKTWNHPVLAHGKLFVRNGEEMACFKLELEDGSTAVKKVAAK
jgi:outer membrane protein assembly factor BamB